MPEIKMIEVGNKKAIENDMRKVLYSFSIVLSADVLKRKITAGVLFLIKNSNRIQHAEDRNTGVGEYREPHGGDSHET